ncbi:hypothetical protein [Citrobacter portucalensis]|uniref:hypothetical protein n=1 Tax=Citrobacter portucalensis TaxID=1639133 RepID=UPI001ABFB3BD|nr:hypothetical protein [Citrobacter portucalensis]
MTTNHPAHGPVSLDRLHQIREILSKAAAQSDGGNIGYAMADAVKVIDEVLTLRNGEQKPAHEYTDLQVDEAVARMEDEGDMVLVPRGVLGAASGAIRHPGHEAGVTMGLLRHYSFRKQPAPVVPDDLAKAFISAIEQEQDRLFGEDYLMDSKDCVDVIREEAQRWNACRAAMLQAGNSPVTPDDVLRMDWLVSKTVDVREPMVYGSHSIFWSQTITDEDDDYHATKLREQIDAAMAAEQAAAPQQENI